MSFAKDTFVEKQSHKYNSKKLDTENDLNLYNYITQTLSILKMLQDS